MDKKIEELYAVERLARARLFRQKYPDSPDEMVLIATGITREDLKKLNEEKQE